MKRDSSGNFSAGTITAASGFNLGGTAFAFGSYANANAFLGFAGNGTMTGSGNTASGSQALAADTTGNSNTASGAYALASDTTGNYDTASGVEALDSNTTGSNNTASGVKALLTNTTGNQNTAIGSQALYYNTGGSNNTAVGYNAGPDQNSPGLLNATAIGANAVVSESNALVLGGTGANAVSVGIGTATPAYTLDVQGSGRFTQPIVFAASQTFPGTGTLTGVIAGTDLTGGGTSGNVTLNVDTTKVVTGVTAGTDLTGGGTGGVQTLNLDTTKVPQLAAANTFTGNQTVNGNLGATGMVTGSSFGIGSNLFAFGSYANRNALLGFAGNATTTGSDNTASGYQALYSNTTGYNNTASGVTALYSNTTGSINTASGDGALDYNTTGNYNTASGSQALYYNTTGYNNTASGFGALIFNTSGFSNTASGYEALYYNTTGGDNTASGYGALSSNTTGNYNTALGYGADVSSGNLTNATAIGAYAKVSQSNSLVLGGTGSSAVKVGIGTTAPDNSLTVNGSADKPGGGSWGTYSDRRLKTVEGNFTSGLSQVLKLRPVRYHYNEGNAMGIRDTEQHVGLVAQEVQAVIPDAVTENSKGYLLVNNDPILWSMLNAIKEQEAQIHQQQEQIQAQQAQMKAQQVRIEKLTRQVKTIQTTIQANGRNSSAVRAVKAEGTTVRQ